MSTHGVKVVKFAILNSDGTLMKAADGGLGTDGVYTLDDGINGTTEADFTGLETAGTAQWANNKLKRNSRSKMAPSLALTALDVNHDALMAILGYTSDSKGGWTLTDGAKPNVAVLVESETIDGTATVYEALPCTEVIETGRSHSTDNTAETDYNTALTITGLYPLAYADTAFNGQPYKMWVYTDTGFSEAEVLAETFGGYATSVSNG